MIGRKRQAAGRGWVGGRLVLVRNGGRPNGQVVWAGLQVMAQQIFGPPYKCSGPWDPVLDEPEFYSFIFFIFSLAFCKKKVQIKNCKSMRISAFEMDITSSTDEMYTVTSSNLKPVEFR
jgi:hypothetical protein